MFVHPYLKTMEYSKMLKILKIYSNYNTVYETFLSFFSYKPITCEKHAKI